MTKPSVPPRLALRLLERIVEREDEFGAAGDLEERYAQLEHGRGAWLARLDSWRQVLAALPGFLRNQLYWSHQMFKSYLKIAFRNLWTHKGYSFINIAGLAIGIACALFILLWVQDELSYDRFHANAKTLYRVEQDQNSGQGKFHHSSTPYGLRSALKAEIPEIREATRVAGGRTFLIRRGETAFFESRVLAVDPSFMKMFSFPIVRGDSETALAGPGSMILAEDLARKYFGADDPIGRTLTVNNQFPVTVTAVIKNVPDASNLRFDALVPMEFLKNLKIDIESWAGNEAPTYVQLHEKSAVAAVKAKITRLFRDRILTDWRGDEANWKRIQADPEQWKRYNSYVAPDFTLMPIVDVRLLGYFGFDRSNQGLKTVTTFALIGLFVLLIACINFMNLATARSVRRAREVGLRKVAGADRRSIAGQFYGESVLTSILAGLASIVLVVIMLPAFNAVAGKTMTLASLFSLKFHWNLLDITNFTGFVAGSYPALVLSSFQPIKVLKGRTSDGARGAGLRRALVVVQFGLSVLLLLGMAVAARQIDFMRGKKLGYDKEQLVYMPLRGEAAKTYAALKERLLRDPMIQGVTGTAQKPSSIGYNAEGATWDGIEPNQRYIIGMEFVDYDYPETMKIEMAAGRSFDRKFSTDETKAFLVNETVAKLMGLTAAAAVGKRFNFWGLDGTIIGVMKDFHFQSVRAPIQPLAVTMSGKNPAEWYRAISYAVVRLKGGDVPGSMKSVEEAWRTVNSDYPLEYRFFDQDFDQMYRADEQTGKILKIFAVLAIVIAGLGLFGLASFTAEQKTREIGVRKVLGASAPSIVVLLSKEFAKWVLVANALAWPAAYFIMRNWLQQFAYKTNIAWWLFATAGGGALVVALLSVSFQALRAAQTDPVKALKYE
jgi:putative ABC transport system permease protein